MREIVLDTETTGLDPLQGHRIVEIGCLELVNHVPTGIARQWYINPERPMPADAAAVHGLTDERLRGEPVFAAVVRDVLDFLADSPLVIHNADFDVGFLNAELKRAGLPRLANPITDTLKLARRKYPGAQASLDALCRRFGVDNSSRSLHGALLDVELLAEVYLELLGGRQPGLTLGEQRAAAGRHAGTPRPQRAPRPHAPTPEELNAHGAFLDQLTNPIWRRDEA